MRKIERKRRRKGGHSWRNPRFREEKKTSKQRKEEAIESRLGRKEEKKGYGIDSESNRVKNGTE